MVKRIEQVLRELDRFQQRRGVLGCPARRSGRGAFAIVIVLLSWLYLSAQVLLYAAEVNVVLARRLWPRSLLQPPLTGPDQRVLTALAQTEERLPQETIEVKFSPEANGDDPHRPG